MANEEKKKEWDKRGKLIMGWVEPNVNALKEEEGKKHFDKQTKDFVTDVKTKLSNFDYHQKSFIKRVNNPDLYRMAFYNVNGFNEKNIPTIYRMLTSLDLDVLFLIETKVTEEILSGEEFQNNSSFKNIDKKYERYICAARSARSGGLMILIKKELFKAGLEEEKLDFIAKPGKSGETYHESCGITLFGVRYIMVYRNNSTANGLALVEDVLKLIDPDRDLPSKDTSPDTATEEEEEKNLEKEKKLEEESDVRKDDDKDDGKEEDKKFVILGDFNTSNIRWANKMESFAFVSTDRSRASEKMINALVNGTGCNIQYVKAPTSGRSMRPIDLLFAKRGQGIVNWVYVPPFLDKQLVRDHVPVYFLVNKFESPRKAAAQTLEKKVEQLHLEKNVSRKSESGKNKKAKK